MILATDSLPTYFTIATPQNSHYAKATNTFDFTNRNSEVLVITCGDSWTWGADLTPSDNEEFRVTHAYGNIVSDRLGADWLNLGQSGSNNFFIAERIEELSNIIPSLNYNKIYLICTFTEIGRSFNSHHDVYLDYVNWFNNNSIYNFLNFLNAECVRRIKQVAIKHNIKLVIGTNFIDAVGIDADVLLPLPWFRLLDIDCPVKGYAGTTGVKRLQSVTEFVNDTSSYKIWMNELIDTSYYIDQVCASPTLVTQHPQSSGHKIWAEYILENIK